MQVKKKKMHGGGPKNALTDSWYTVKYQVMYKIQTHCDVIIATCGNLSGSTFLIS